MTVREAMSSPAITVRDTDSALDGLKGLVASGISGAPVVCADGRLAGIVTEFDLLLAIDHVGEHVPISRIMTRDLLFVAPETDIEEARRLILEHHFRRLPVVNENKVVGIIARRDILRIRFGI